MPTPYKLVYLNPATETFEMNRIVHSLFSAMQILCD